MNCPVCLSIELADERLDAYLFAKVCPQCRGRWIGGKQYWEWMDLHQKDLPLAAPEATAESVPTRDSGPAKRCPECGRFLTRGRVGHGVDFHLDRCAGCGGIWFDANEWEILKQRGLHDDVHFVFSSAWQAEVARRQRQVSHEQVLRQKLGEETFNEISRIRAWLETHPRRAELYAFLLDRRE